MTDPKMPSGDAPDQARIPQSTSMNAAAEWLAPFEDKADALLQAYRTGTPESMARHWRLTWHQRSWSAMRTYVQIDLGHQASPDIDISLDDARWLVAREHGYEDWAALQRMASSSERPAHLPTRVTDASLAAVMPSPLTQHLDLSGTEITDEGVAQLRLLRDLRSLSLAWTRVTDAGVVALRGLPHLESIDLMGTACGDDSIRALASCPNLRIFASGQQTTDDGLALFHEYAAFREWSAADGSPDEDIEHPRTLLRLRGRITPRGVAALRDLNGLAALDLDDRALGLTGAALRPLMDLPRLHTLAFDTDDDAMDVIAHMPHLRRLGCQDTECSDRGWQALGQSRSIERIWGRRCYGLATEGFLALSRIPTLRNLSVSCRNVDDRGLQALPAFPALRELMPMDIPDDGYRHIGRCTALDALTLMYCRDTTDIATEHLISLPQLRRYFASYTQVTDRTPELLSRVSSLESVTFDSCAKLTNAGIAQLARLPKLRELRVSGRGLTSAVQQAFPSTVAVHYSL